MRLIDAHKYTEHLNTIMRCWNCSSCLSPSEARVAVGHLQTAVSVLNEQPTVNPYEWISVEDRLPSWEDGKVLIYTPYGISIAQRTTGNRWKGDCAIPKLITHWMPLPTPPTEKEN